MQVQLRFDGDVYRILDHELMDHLIFGFVEVEMRNVERSERLDRFAQGIVGFTAAPGQLKIPPHAAQRAQPTRTVEALSLTVFAERHAPHANGWHWACQPVAGRGARVC